MSRREKLEKMLESSPDDVFLHYALALELVSAGDATAGKQRLEHTLQVDPNYVAAYFQLGQLLAGEDDPLPAQTILRKGIVVARQVGDAHAEGEMSSFLATLG